MRPVMPMPTDSTAAPRPYPFDVASCLASANAHEQHGPREGRAGLLDRPVAPQQLGEASLRPVVQVAGRVARRAPVGAAGHVEPAPARLAGDRHELPAPGL